MHFIWSWRSWNHGMRSLGISCAPSINPWSMIAWDGRHWHSVTRGYTWMIRIMRWGCMKLCDRSVGRLHLFKPPRADQMSECDRQSQHLAGWPSITSIHSQMNLDTFTRSSCQKNCIMVASGTPNYPGYLSLIVCICGHSKNKKFLISHGVNPATLHTLSTRGTPVNEAALRGKPWESSLNLLSTQADQLMSTHRRHEATVASDKTSSVMNKVEHTMPACLTLLSCGSNAGVPLEEMPARGHPCRTISATPKSPITPLKLPSGSLCNSRLSSLMSAWTTRQLCICASPVAYCLNRPSASWMLNSSGNL